MAKFRKARRVYSRVKKRYSRHKTTSGLMGNVMAGAVVGAGIQFAAPYVNQYIPAVAGIRPTNLALVGGGVALKSFLHKGGKFADAMVILGVAGIAADLVAGNLQGATGGGGENVY